MESYKLVIILLIVELEIVSAISSPMSNQLWWLKRTRELEQGCSGMCCSGRNSTCFNSGPTMSNKPSVSGRCFCDEGCLDMGDCCEDYSVECQAVDCVVDEWKDYDECSKPCGLGAKTRTRQVIQEPRNGGQACPALKESTICIGKRCKTQRHLGVRGRNDRATARIMPATYGQFRTYTKYNAHMDIRKNLFYKYYAQKTVERRGYCAKFKITSARQYCSNNNVPWANVLNKGSEICVECQTKAMDGEAGTTCLGHGTIGKDTFWTAINAHGCHGWWQRTNELSECSCNGIRGLDFIFV